MHGFNQGYAAVNELIENYQPNIFLLQEHWLTPANLCKFNIFSDYFTFGCSAMNNCVDSGMLVGRPFGGVIAMISNSLRNLTRTIFCSDRYVIIKVGNYIIVNVYLPCSGTPDRLLLCQDIFNEFWTRCENYVNHEYVIAGDFNTDLDSKDVVACFINSFCVSHSLIRCDNVFPLSKTATYVNESLNQ